ncbi:hypothetical protein B0H16DRAFT_386448 [Mycena metata]|uniref:Uncharacterized protein n=1 Tax=Mycena metata TaxID=1033252 RepID=A0AAD7JJG4_9AGAR|nr:hypothetical protein B0H16DRAFT_386448 [Mycena metata]
MQSAVESSTSLRTLVVVPWFDLILKTFNSNYRKSPPSILVHLPTAKLGGNHALRLLVRGGSSTTSRPTWTAIPRTDLDARDLRASTLLSNWGGVGFRRRGRSVGSRLHLCGGSFLRSRLHLCGGSLLRSRCLLCGDGLGRRRGSRTSSLGFLRRGGLGFRCSRRLGRNCRLGRSRFLCGGCLGCGGCLRCVVGLATGTWSSRGGRSGGGRRRSGGGRRSGTRSRFDGERPRGGDYGVDVVADNSLQLVCPDEAGDIRFTDESQGRQFTHPGGICPSPTLVESAAGSTPVAMSMLTGPTSLRAKVLGT